VRSNANRAHTEGFELEAAADPVDGLTLTANASYLKTEFDSFANAATSVVNGQTVLLGATGNQLPFSPQWQLYGAAAYKIPYDLHGDLQVGADVTYESSYFSDVFNYSQGRVSAQSFLDGYLTYTPQGSHWVFTLTGHNLANRLHYQSITWGGTPNLWEGPVNPPRTIFFKIAYKL
jgi:iron complex outermembrane receptor protein